MKRAAARRIALIAEQPKLNLAQIVLAPAGVLQGGIIGVTSSRLDAACSAQQLTV